ncbi:MAG TPA: hypothetical protein VN516_02810, partial [Candidatus Baltobacteraceae bacterium]|nr:hypothetical protein [Candidatus Baltobacteraceae bacterium]
WGAWSVDILFMISAVVLIALLLSWTILAGIYCLPVSLLGFFTNRNLSIPASFKLSGAALMPGALLMTAGILFYNFGFLNLVSLSFIFAAHFLVGWIYLIVSFFFIARISADKPKENPFKPAKA